MMLEGAQKLAFTIPLMEPLPPQYYVRMVSDNWLHVRTHTVTASLLHAEQQIG